MSDYNIRPISKYDNSQIAEVIRRVLLEFGVPKVGTAYADKSLDCMFETYDGSRKLYFVVVENGKITGGAGIQQLEDGEENICELQKMYFAPQSRGKGIGAKMMQICLEKAKSFGFEYCYLETMPYMENARKLYTKSGFESLEKPMGDTGHYSCNVWMLKKL
ncbi:MAG TPA: GNAT family N-acetyltransferase [Flavobacteriaceae bacterium]|nr:GNAT family N-acetyltransferase [Flavobacteriaceae bacterium]